MARAEWEPYPKSSLCARGAVSKVAQSHVRVIFLLRLRQTDGAGQRKNEAQSNSKTCSQPSEEPARSSHSPGMAALLPGVPLGWGWGALGATIQRWGAQPQKNAHLAPLPLPCIQLALNKCSLGDWEVGPAPRIFVRGAGGGRWTSELPALCVSRCFLTSCAASLAALSTTPGARPAGQTCAKRG